MNEKQLVDVIELLCDAFNTETAIDDYEISFKPYHNDPKLYRVYVKSKYGNIFWHYALEYIMEITKDTNTHVYIAEDTASLH